MHSVLTLVMFFCAFSFASETLEQKITKAYDMTGNRMSLVGESIRFKNSLQQGKAAEMATRAIEAALIKGTDEIKKRGYKKYNESSYCSS